MSVSVFRRGQFQWLALLAAAILLPTITLLWFMDHAVSNERLVVRQKLAAVYQDKLTDASARTEAHLAGRMALLGVLQPQANPYTLFRKLVLEQDVQGVVVWDQLGGLVYPRSADVITESGSPPDSPIAGAWQEEFARGNYAAAADLYSASTGSADPRLAIAALVGRSRCLRKLDHTDEAIAECEKAAFAGPAASRDPVLLFEQEKARLLLLSMLRQPGAVSAHAALCRRAVAAIEEGLYIDSAGRASLPPSQNLFIAQKLLDFLREFPTCLEPRLTSALQKLAAAEEWSVTAAEELPRPRDALDRVEQIDLGGKVLYGVRHDTNAGHCLLLLSEAGISSLLSAYRDNFAGSETAYRVLDAKSVVVAGTAAPGEKALAAGALPAEFPGWKAEVCVQGGEVFQRAADRQIAVYTWTGILVIVLILAVGALATRAMGRQIRLNAMKNDFIATVSHELKTPLASMRVLVDTLLEGNLRDEAQAKEYLRLTAKENERLSRMIDNFLTFSRMERNKQAFSMAPTSPAAMARDAVESVQTKFAMHHCQLSVQIAENLPDIQADHDAVVTVLTNLLDNACKYTDKDKQISLRVYAEHDKICFAVSDNGIGLTRRQARRIFERFYQVDNSLARKVEGCGLGLSIVKFIVDAHKGSISVDSKPGKGSTFTVRLAGDPDGWAEPENIPT